MCRMAHFGNCDPETADQEYCIFHKPDKTEEEAVEFYRKFLGRFKPRVEEIEADGEKIKRLVFEEPVDARGFVFPEIPDVPIEYTDKESNEWNRGVTFEHVRFEHIDLSMTGFMEANFNNMEADRLILRGAHIKRAHFKDAKFGILVGRYAYFEWADFQNSSFEEGDFEEATFKTVHFERSEFFEANFDDVQFENAYFNDARFGGVSFIDTKFGDVSFSGAQFDYADFTTTIFGGKTIFEKTVFSMEALFSSSKFNKDVIFSKAKFNGKYTIFSRAIFGGTALFDSAEFGKVIFNFAVFEKVASFKNAVFHEDVHFEDVEFKKTVEFQSAKFEGDAIFNGSTFEKRLIFVEKDTSKEPKPKFHGKLELSNCDFRQGVSFVVPPESNTEDAVKKIEGQLRGLFDPDSPAYSYSVQEAARVQRLSFEKEGKRDEADQLFVVEMRERRKIRLQQAKDQGLKSTLRVLFVNFGEWILADFPSNYGTAWRRLLALAMSIILGNAVVYTIWSSYINGFSGSSNLFVRFANALYYSLVTFTTLGYGDMHPTGWLKALSAIEALTGAVFMALIVAVIARKWMR